MTGKSMDTPWDDLWDGPTWARPEHAGRLASRPEPGRHDPVLGCFTRWLDNGLLEETQFLAALRLKQKIEAKERA